VFSLDQMPERDIAIIDGGATTFIPGLICVNKRDLLCFRQETQSACCKLGHRVRRLFSQPSRWRSRNSGIAKNLISRQPHINNGCLSTVR
jgi:hypothetical protein